MKSQSLGIVFDGTSRLGEIVAIVARWCDENFVLHHRALSAHTLAMSADGRALANLIGNVLSKKYDVRTVVEKGETEDGEAPRIVGFTRDSAAVNGAAVRQLKDSFVLSVDVLCISHTLDNIGKKIEFENDGVTILMNAWLNIAHSVHARLIWQSLTNASMPTYSSTRWWSRSEVQNHIFEHFAHLKDFANKLEEQDLCISSVPALLQLLNDPENYFWLHLCLAALYDVSTPLISATYALEGNGLEILLAYDRIQKLRALGTLLRQTKERISVMLQDGLPPRTLENAADIPSQQLPSVAKLIKDRVEDPQVGMVVSKSFADAGRFLGRVIRKEIVRDNDEDVPMYLVQYSDNDKEHLSLEACRAHFTEFADGNYVNILNGLIPAFDYLERRLNGTCHQAYNCSPSLEIFRLAQMFDPVMAKGYSSDALQLDLQRLERLNCFGELGAGQISGEKSKLILEMEKELPDFITVVQHVDASRFDYDKPPEFTGAVLDWWRDKRSRIPNWARAAQIIFALPPSSAAAERIFSILASSFDHSRQSALQDLVEGTLLVRFDSLQRRLEEGKTEGVGLEEQLGS